MSIQDKIRQAREMNSLTQENVAERLNMTSSGYAKIERGITQLKFDKLEKIAQIFNMDIAELLSLGRGGVNVVMGDFVMMKN